MTTSFEVETTAEVSADRMFNLARSIDAHIESMGATDERAVGGTTSGLIELGETVTWSARHLGIRWRLTSEITEMTEPTSFTDEQVRGPFKKFRHEHLFVSDGTGSRMIDRIEFAAPLGPLGWLAERLVLRRYLQNLITKRGQALVQASLR